jgi:diaminopimelate epimerase
MEISFKKYHGTGNDFIMIDARKLDESKFLKENVKFLCNRHTGIGADGLILLSNSEKYDFRMKYFNSDGNEGTMCGNGGRCITAFAKSLGIIKDSATFEGIDGLHEARFLKDKIISLKMIDVNKVEKLEDGYLLDTGSRHFVVLSENIENIDVYNVGKEIRYQNRFGKEGTNVNFIEIHDSGVKIRTYERGVENETLSCGTGTVAAAISAYTESESDKISFKIFALGGELKVEFQPQPVTRFENIWLTGPIEYVFEGKIIV